LKVVSLLVELVEVGCGRPGAVRLLHFGAARYVPCTRGWKLLKLCVRPRKLASRNVKGVGVEYKVEFMRPSHAYADLLGFARNCSLLHPVLVDQYLVGGPSIARAAPHEIGRVGLNANPSNKSFPMPCQVEICVIACLNAGAIVVIQALRKGLTPYGHESLLRHVAARDWQAHEEFGRAPARRAGRGSAPGWLAWRSADT
jgi:hypothetical protein